MNIKIDTCMHRQTLIRSDRQTHWKTRPERCMCVDHICVLVYLCTHVSTLTSLEHLYCAVVCMHIIVFACLFVHPPSHVFFCSSINYLARQPICVCVILLSSCSALLWSVHGVCVSEALKRWSKCQIRHRPFVRKYGAKAEPFVRYAHVHTCHPQQHTMNTPHYAHSLTHYLLYVRACVRVIILDFVVVRGGSPSHRSGINEHLFCP